MFTLLLLHTSALPSAGQATGFDRSGSIHAMPLDWCIVGGEADSPQNSTALR